MFTCKPNLMTSTRAALPLQGWLDRRLVFHLSRALASSFSYLQKGVTPSVLLLLPPLLPVVPTQQVSGQVRPLQLLLQGAQPSTSDGVCDWVGVDSHEGPELLCEQEHRWLIPSERSTGVLQNVGAHHPQPTRQAKSCLTPFLSTDTPQQRMAWLWQRWRRADVADPPGGTGERGVYVCVWPTQRG